jgi:hypothetical protein
MSLAIIGAAGARRTETAIARAATASGVPVLQTAAVRHGRAVDPDEVVRRIEAFAPERLLLTRHAAALGLDRIEHLARRFSTAFWYFDAPLTDDVVALGRAAGTMYVTCRGLIEECHSRGVPTVSYLPQAADPWYDRPARWTLPIYQCDVSFIGSGQYARRYELLRRIDEMARLQIRGAYWADAPRELPVRGGPVYGRAFARAVRGAAVSLGIHAFGSQGAPGGCQSNRVWKVLAAGGFFLGEHAADMDLLTPGVHCASYRDEDEAMALTRRYLGDPAERHRIAEAGRTHTLKHHTYAHRLRAVMAGGGYRG